MKRVPVSTMPIEPDRSWLESPCSSCSQSPCCRNLPLHILTIETHSDLQAARHILDHRYMEIGVKDDGTWTVFYTRPCRFLDVATSKCTLHGTGAQPNVCQMYNPHNCWYRKVFATTLGSKMIRLNAARMDWILANLTFDRDGTIASVPSWETMLTALSEIALTLDACELSGAGTADEPDRGTVRPYGSESRLVFPPGKPRRLSHFDLVRFRLGFPGVRLGIGESDWYFVVDAPARRAEGGAAAFHVPERDAVSLVLVDLDNLPVILRLCEAAPDGTIITHPAPGVAAVAIATSRRLPPEATPSTPRV